MMVRKSRYRMRRIRFIVEIMFVMRMNRFMMEDKCVIMEMTWFCAASSWTSAPSRQSQEGQRGWQALSVNRKHVKSLFLAIKHRMVKLTFIARKERLSLFSGIIACSEYRLIRKWTLSFGRTEAMVPPADVLISKLKESKVEIGREKWTVWSFDFKFQNSLPVGERQGTAWRGKPPVCVENYRTIN